MYFCQVVFVFRHVCSVCFFVLCIMCVCFQFKRCFDGLLLFMMLPFLLLEQHPSQRQPSTSQIELEDFQTAQVDPRASNVTCAVLLYFCLSLRLPSLSLSSSLSPSLSLSLLLSLFFLYYIYISYISSFTVHGCVFSVFVILLLLLLSSFKFDRFQLRIHFFPVYWIGVFYLYSSPVACSRNAQSRLRLGYNKYIQIQQFQVCPIPRFRAFDLSCDRS